MTKSVKLVHRSVFPHLGRRQSFSSCPKGLYTQRFVCPTHVKDTNTRTVHSCYLKSSKSGLKLSLPFVHCHWYCSNITFMQCWNCDNEVPLHTQLCGKCNSLQPFDHKINNFEILGVQKMFNVDAKILKKTFKKLQIRFHPDKFSNKSQVGYFACIFGIC